MGPEAVQRGLDLQLHNQPAGPRLLFGLFAWRAAAIRSSLLSSSQSSSHLAPRPPAPSMPHETTSALSPLSPHPFEHSKALLTLIPKTEAELIEEEGRFYDEFPSDVSSASSLTPILTKFLDLSSLSC